MLTIAGIFERMRQGRGHFYIPGCLHELRWADLGGPGSVQSLPPAVGSLNPTAWGGGPSAIPVFRWGHWGVSLCPAWCPRPDLGRHI